MKAEQRDTKAGQLFQLSQIAALGQKGFSMKNKTFALCGELRQAQKPAEKTKNKNYALSEDLLSYRRMPWDFGLELQSSKLGGRARTTWKSEEK